MKKTIVMGLMGLAIVLGICMESRGAINCADGVTYPVYPSDTFPEHNLGEPFHPVEATTVLNGVAGWFGIGNIGDIGMSGYHLHAKKCVNGQEAWYKHEVSSGSLDITIQASVGPSSIPILGNIAGAVEGVGGVSEGVLSNLLATINAPEAQVSFRYDGRVRKEYHLDEAACSATGWYDWPYAGQEDYTLSGAIVFFENEDVMVDIGRCSCSYTKFGRVFGSGNEWATAEIIESEIISSYRIGVDGQTTTEVHVPFFYALNNLESGEWCISSLI